MASSMDQSPPPPAPPPGVWGWTQPTRNAAMQMHRIVMGRQIKRSLILLSSAFFSVGADCSLTVLAGHAKQAVVQYAATQSSDPGGAPRAHRAGGAGAIHQARLLRHHDPRDRTGGRAHRG